VEVYLVPELFDHDFLPQLRPANHALKPLKPGAKINLFSF
jgi:hypothetical protein